MEEIHIFLTTFQKLLSQPEIDGPPRVLQNYLWLTEMTVASGNGSQSTTIATVSPDKALVICVVRA